MPQPTYTLANIATHPAFVEIEADAKNITALAIKDGVINGQRPRRSQPRMQPGLRSNARS